MKERIKDADKGIWITFLVTVVSGIYKIMEMKTLGLISDDIGQLAVCTRLAGLDWGNVIEETSYYGWGINVLFFVFFKFLKNPIIIIECIYAFNIILSGITSVLAYVVLNSYNKKCEINILLAVSLSFMQSYLWHNSVSVYFVIWLIVWTVNKIFSCKGAKKYIFIICLSLELCYSLTIHERNMALLISFVATFLIFMVKNWKTTKVQNIFFVCSLIIFYLFEQLIKSFVIKNVWEIEDGAALLNTSVINGNIRWWLGEPIHGILIILEGLISNIFTASSRSLGFFVVACICAICVFIRCFLSRNEIKINEYIILFLVLTAGIVIGGLAVQWGEGVAIDYYPSYKGYTYWRYYEPYVISSVVLVMNNYSEDKKIKVSGILVYVVIATIWMAKIEPKIEYAQSMTNVNLYMKNVVMQWVDNFASDGNLIAISIKALVVISLLIICCKKKVVFWTIYLSVFILTYPVTERTFTNIEYSSYDSIMNLYLSDKSEKLPREVYCVSNNCYTLQFILKDEKVILGMPDKYNDKIFVYSNNKIEMDSRYKEIQLDENEYVYVGSALISEIIQ